MSVWTEDLARNSSQNYYAPGFGDPAGQSICSLIYCRQPRVSLGSYVSSHCNRSWLGVWHSTGAMVEPNIKAHWWQMLSHDVHLAHLYKFCWRQAGDPPLSFREYLSQSWRMTNLPPAIYITNYLRIFNHIAGSCILVLNFIIDQLNQSLTVAATPRRFACSTILLSLFWWGASICFWADNPQPLVNNVGGGLFSY